jgi:predicted MFS family arabinose efflux permease
MSSLAILLLLSRHLGYGRAGLATGVSVASASISNVLLARAVDRVGPRRVIAPAAIGYAALATLLAILRHGPYGAQLAVCAGIGLVTPPITSVSRGTWLRLLGGERAQVVYGLEATAQELVFIAGPAVVALIAGLSGPAVAVVASGGLGLAGALAYVSAPPFRVAPTRTARASRNVLLGTGLVWYSIVAVCLSTGFTMVEIATVDFVSGRTASGTSGVVLAVWSVGSLLGGIRFGAAKARVTDRVLAIAIAIAATGLAAAALSPDTVGLGAILFVGGASVAPAMARLYSRVGAVAPEGASTEAFGWLAVGFLIGSSAGAALGGGAVDAIGARSTFVVAGASAFLSVVAITAGSRSQRGRPVDR